MIRSTMLSFSRFARLDVVKLRLRRSYRDKLSMAQRLMPLASKIGEKCGLGLLCTHRSGLHPATRTRGNARSAQGHWELIRGSVVHQEAGEI